MGNIIWSQISIILPFNDSQYKAIISMPSDSVFQVATQTGDTNAYYHNLLLSNTISAKAQDAYGTVTQRETIMDTAKLGNTRMTACRHGNGTDWWLVKGSFHENKLYTFRVTKDSTVGPLVQAFPQMYWPAGELAGAAAFNKEGNKYAAVSYRNKSVFLADFDRCAGNFSNAKEIPIPDLWANNPYDTNELDEATMGVAFAPGGQFLYVCRFYNIQ